MTPFRGYRVILGAALLLASASVFLSAYLFTRLSDQQDSINNSREGVAVTICAAINHDRSVLRSLIVAGAESSKPFEGIYRRYHLPPYPKRVEMAQRAAGRLSNVPCKSLARAVERASHP